LCLIFGVCNRPAYEYNAESVAWNDKVINEVEETWEWSCPNLRHFIHIFLDEVRKTTKTTSVCLVYGSTFLVGHPPSSPRRVSNSTARHVFIEFLSIHRKTPCL
jgi:hypothetical protein